jgi:uncharacterized protein YggE
MRKTVRIVLDTRLVLTILVVIIVALTLAWRSAQADNQARKITVAGHARIKAQPDYYLFTAQYQSEGKTQPSLDKLNARMSDIIDSLEKLGVISSAIQLEVSAYDQGSDASQQGAVTAYLNVTVTQPNIAQAVKDYLATTNPTYTGTPVTDFSETKRKNLQIEARDKAIADAKIQAERTARQLDTKLNKVLEIRDTVTGDIVSLTAEKVDKAHQGSAHIVAEKEIGFSVEAVFIIR